MTASIGRGHKRATDEQVIAAYQATRSVWKAAKQLGLAGQTVHERLRRLGIEPAHARWTSEEDAELRRLFGDPHLTAADVAKRLNRTSASVSCRAGELSIEKARAPKNKRIPRGKGYDKASVLKHLNRFSANEESISLTQYCRKNHLSIDNFAVATQKHYPLWWQE